MLGDGLHDPLGSPRPQSRRFGVAAWPLFKIAMVCAALGLGVLLLAKGSGDRGEPFAVATIDHPPPPPALAPPPEARADGNAAGDAPVQAEADRVRSERNPADIVTEDGVAVVRLKAAAGPGAMIIKVPQAASGGLAPAPDPRLIERSAFGPLPKIGADGTRPAAAYARPPARDAPALAGKPRIAILIGGMGLNQATTAEAARALPGAVSFGFAPYGDDAEMQVKSAREAGHEVVLQIPMEDFGHAEAGLSHMLLADQNGNRDRLHWLMSRFTGYAGVSNYLGGRFLGNEEALRPVLQDVAARGLFFVDDGTAPRSLVAAMAPELGLPSVRADVVLDAKPDQAAVTEALNRLETLARQRGWALGTASALPETNAILARDAADLARQGFDLVPVSEIAKLSQGLSTGTNPPAAARSEAALPQASARP